MKTWHDPIETTQVYGYEPMQLELQMNLPENGQIWKHQPKEEPAAVKNLYDLFDKNSR